MRKIRILLADRNYAMLDYLALYLSQQLKQACVSLESSGQLMRAIGATVPDVAVVGTDMEAALRLWNRFREISPGTCPKLILLASEGCVDEETLGKQYGAQSCLKKPIAPSNLLEAILAAVRADVPPRLFASRPLAEYAQGDCVLRICLFLGMSVRLAGYDYVRECVYTLTRESMPRWVRATDLFHLVAERRGTTPAAVERLIRYALAATWKRGCVERANLLLGDSIFPLSAPPSCAEFIATLSHFARELQAMEKELRMDH